MNPPYINNSDEEMAEKVCHERPTGTGSFMWLLKNKQILSTVFFSFNFGISGIIPEGGLDKGTAISPRATHV